LYISTLSLVELHEVVLVSDERLLWQPQLRV